MGHIDWNAVIIAAIAFLGSAGIWNYIDHRQQRQAEIELQNSEVLKELKCIREEIAEIKGGMAENEAKLRRVRILRFADEIFMNVRHTKDSFDQVLSDITDYESYCDLHPDFKNNQTGETVKYIKRVYLKRMEKKDFAQYEPKDLDETV